MDISAADQHNPEMSTASLNTEWLNCQYLAMFHIASLFYVSVFLFLNALLRKKTYQALTIHFFYFIGSHFFLVDISVEQ